MNRITYMFHQAQKNQLKQAEIQMLFFSPFSYDQHHFAK